VALMGTTAPSKVVGEVISFPTPSTTIEAVMYSLRERGLSCLDEFATCDRLRRCDEAAMREISERLLDMHKRSNGRLNDWPTADVEKVLATWRRVRR
jgi:hypothetical protein